MRTQYASFARSMANAMNATLSVQWDEGVNGPMYRIDVMFDGRCVKVFFTYDPRDAWLQVYGFLWGVFMARTYREACGIDL